jgi:hypothetical protein
MRDRLGNKVRLQHILDAIEANLHVLKRALSSSYAIERVFI